MTTGCGFFVRTMPTPLAFSLSIALFAIPAEATATDAYGNTATVLATGETSQRLQGDTFVLGDQLKITVYENFAAASSKPGDPALMSLVERSEITGSYVVQEDGSIFLPLVGGIATFGATVTQLETAIQTSFASRLGARVAVAIQLLEREPIYVTGDLPQSGVFRYSPGMTALHALALAGGAAVQGGADKWRMVDLARERERIAQAENRLARVLARLTVLAEEKGSSNEGAMQRLVELSGRPAADRLIAEERAVRDLEEEQLVSQSAAAAGVVVSLNNERAILTESLADAETALQDKAERLSFMQDLRARGTTTDQNVNIVRGEYVLARSTWNDLRGMLARVERTLVETRHRDARALTDYRIATERAFLATRQSITEEETTRSLMENVVKALRSLPVGDEDRAAAELRVEIVRRTTDGIMNTEGDLLSPLRPGDVLNIQRRDPSSSGESARLVH